MTEISPRIHVYLKKARNLGCGTFFGRHFFTRPTFRRINTQKQCLIELFGKEGNNIPVFYGGSVNPENAPELFVQPHIDGLFIGRSAWDAEKFYTLMSGLLTE